MPIDTERRPDSTPALNAVSIAGSDKTSTLGSVQPPYRYFAKMGLYVRAGHPVTLQVADQGANRIAIGWGTNYLTWTKRLIISGCNGSTDSGRWLVYPGGFVVDAADCVRIEVTSQGRTKTLNVPIGMACPKS